MITLEATKQVADDSPDHICPVGAIRDNFTSEGLIEEVKYGFDNEQISMLDLGCAGGQFVVDFIKRGDIGGGSEKGVSSRTAPLDWYLTYLNSGKLSKAITVETDKAIKKSKGGGF